MNKEWSRRSFTKAVISAQVLLASGVLTLPLACVDNEKGKGPSALNSSQQVTLRFAMDEIIPANDIMPSASAVGGVDYILNIIKEIPELLPLFQSLTDKIESRSLQYSDASFTDINKKERINILTQFEQTEPELFKVLKDFTYESYYTHEQVYQLIKYEPHPTGSLGPKMEPFNEDLLTRVMKMPAMYTKI